ncbi:chitin synthesis regulation, resistance to congo red-domain-containing protein [Annulohypoxylon moriforme]|nr:chitin synthesis regulation, resistance to congo red-domain-containing protein [Annulohypoxylon moriforme]
MAPFIDQVDAQLAKRQYCNNGYYYDRWGNCYSAWSWYGRWIFAAVVIVLILAIFFIWACVNSRRRRRQGLQPMYGTGWMAGNQGGQNAYYNNPQGYNTHQPPPAYGQAYPMDNQYTGTTFNRDDGYYGQHEGVVQPPKNVYNNGGAKTDYAPPEGPPPNR